MPGKQDNAHSTWHVLSAELEAAEDDWQDVEHPEENNTDDQLELDKHEKPVIQFSKLPRTDRIEGR